MSSRVVLVADDNLTVQRVAGEMLAREGLEVVTVANGMAAIKKLADVKPLVVLADADMPGKDGYEVCDFVKRQPDMTYVRVLLAVSDGDPFDPVRGAQAGVDGVVKKPFDRENLVSAVFKSLGEAQALCPQPPQPETFNPWQSPRELTGDSAPEHDIPSSAFIGDIEFSSSSFSTDVQGLPAEFLEPSAPPIVEWPVASSSFAGELRLESPTPASEFPSADTSDGWSPMARSGSNSKSEPPRTPADAASDFGEPPKNAGQAFTTAVEPGDAARLENQLAGLPPNPSSPLSSVAEAQLSDSDRTATQISPPIFSLKESTNTTPARELAAPDIPIQEDAEKPAPLEVTGGEPASPAPSAHSSLIASVVHSVVARMAPPALSRESIQGLEEKLTEEILLQLTSKPASGGW